MRRLTKLDELLEELRAEERTLSRRRRRLHDRLAIFPSEFGTKQERELSRQRRELHARIDELEEERRALTSTEQQREAGEAEPGGAFA